MGGQSLCLCQRHRATSRGRIPGQDLPGGHKRNLQRSQTNQTVSLDEFCRNSSFDNLLKARKRKFKIIQIFALRYRLLDI